MADLTPMSLSPAAPPFETIFADAGDLSDQLARRAGRAVFLFTLPGCEACERFKEAFAQASVPPEMGVVALVEITEYTADLKRVCDAYQVAEFPTLVWVLDGKPYDAWAGFFADPDPAERLRLLQAELDGAVNGYRLAAGEGAARD